LNAVATAGALTAADDVAPTGMPRDPAALAAVAFHLLPSVSFSTAPGGPSALRRSAMLNFWMARGTMSRSWTTSGWSDV